MTCWSPRNVVYPMAVQENVLHAIHVHPMLMDTLPRPDLDSLAAQHAREEAADAKLMAALPSVVPCSCCYFTRRHMFPPRVKLLRSRTRLGTMTSASSTAGSCETTMARNRDRTALSLKDIAPSLSRL